MNHPLDSSDLASLIQADWHEEYGDILVADDIRESVACVPANGWCYEIRTQRINAQVGSVGISIRVGVVVMDGYEPDFGTTLPMHPQGVGAIAGVGGCCSQI